MHGRGAHATLNKAPVNASHLQNFLRGQAGIRIETATAAYLHRALQDPRIASLALMGSDARTGVAMRKILTADALREGIEARVTT
jgi:hypothetical protein